MQLAVFIILTALWCAALIWSIRYVGRRTMAEREACRQLRAINPLCQSDIIDFQDTTIGLTGGPKRWQSCGLVISAEAITLYPVSIRYYRASVTIGHPI